MPFSRSSWITFEVALFRSGLEDIVVVSALGVNVGPLLDEGPEVFQTEGMASKYFQRLYEDYSFKVLQK